MLSNEKVVQCWLNNQKAENNSMSTTSGMLWSYGLVIGITRDGKKVVYDYTGKNKVSQTTSSHVNLSKKYADIVEEPPQ